MDLFPVVCVLICIYMILTLCLIAMVRERRQLNSEIKRLHRELMSHVPNSNAVPPGFGKEIGPAGSLGHATNHIPRRGSIPIPLGGQHVIDDIGVCLMRTRWAALHRRLHTPGNHNIRIC